MPDEEQEALSPREIKLLRANKKRFFTNLCRMIEVHILDRGSRSALVLYRGILDQLHEECRLLTKDLSLALA